MNFKKDEIIQLTYWKRAAVPTDYVMREASKMFSNYLHNYAIAGHLGAEQMDPATAMEHFRTKARQMMEGHGVPITINTQIGQLESQEYIRKIQSGPDFIRWDNPVMVQSLLEF